MRMLVYLYFSINVICLSDVYFPILCLYFNGFYSVCMCMIAFEFHYACLLCSKSDAVRVVLYSLIIFPFFIPLFIFLFSFPESR